LRLFWCCATIGGKEHTMNATRATALAKWINSTSRTLTAMPMIHEKDSSFYVVRLRARTDPEWSQDITSWGEFEAMLAGLPRVRALRVEDR
jgi:hypothetical protein